MLAGIELGVFNQLSEPQTADAVAEAFKNHPEDARLFLDDLAVCDLVTKNDGTYRNIAIAQEFLVEGSPTYIGTFFAIFTQISLYAGHNDLSKLVLLDKNPQLWGTNCDLPEVVELVKEVISIKTHRLTESSPLIPHGSVIS